MKLLYNPFKRKKKPSVQTRLNQLGNFTWDNKKKIDKLSALVDELTLSIEAMTTPKRGRPRKNV
tara:strand:- start:1323 stop:1514 length:192 start_codon:yes stop_codon:yes gene_type:complete